jgi:hypothetical protein
MNLKAILLRLAKILLLIVIALLLFCWITLSRKVVSVSLGEGREGKWQLNQWYTGRCLFSYYENGVFKGNVRTFKGPFEWPVAVFPGLTAETVICIYELDTTIAVFTIDLTKRNTTGIPPPKSLAETVLFSNFEVRACTKAEVAYLNQYISANALALDTRTFALKNSNEPEQLKHNLLYAMALGTVPHEERSGDWMYYSHPQIPPED